MSALAESKEYLLGLPKRSEKDYGSPELNSLSEFIAKIVRDIRNTEALSRNLELSQTLAELNEIEEECSSNNWNGQNAKAITDEAYLYAKDIIENMLTARFLNIRMPDYLTSLPGGQIAFYWENELGNKFTFSIDGNKILHFAAKYPSSRKLNGTEYLGDFLPSRILDELKKFPLND